MRTYPSMDKQKAMQLSNKISSATKKAGLSTKVATAIARQESNYQMVDSCKQVLIEGTEQLVRGCTDLGMFQIHIGTAQQYGLDLLLLSIDLEYNLKAYITVMKDKIKQCQHLGDTAWTCYHSTTEKYRVQYYHLVSRWF
jgi:hypothetical protein